VTKPSSQVSERLNDEMTDNTSGKLFEIKWENDISWIFKFSIRKLWIKED
jgi:hypothetical protein